MRGLLFRLRRSAAGQLKIATYGDSRATLVSGTASPDMFSTDGVSRSCRTSVTNQPCWVSSLPLFRKDCVITVDGGVSGEVTNSWNGGARSGGKTNTAVKALPWDAIFIQYGTNDIQQGINSTLDATRVTVANAAAANIQALITDLLTTGRVVIFQTCMQRSVAGYSTTYSPDRVITCDYLNYGNGGSVQGMVPWCTAHAAYGTKLFVHDVQALTNIGGVATGANADTAWLGDGIHPGYYGARRIANTAKTLLDTIFPARSVNLPFFRAVGPNLMPAVSSTYYGGEILSTCTKSAITYGTDSDGRPYGEVTITPSGTGYYKFELLADVGTNGGRTPLGGTITAGDLIKYRAFLTIDDGAGAVAATVNNVFLGFYVSYIGGTPALQQTLNGQNTQGATTHALPDNAAEYILEPTKIAVGGDSSLIGAPAGSSGMRAYHQIYHTVGAAYRVRWTAPEFRKVV